MVKISQTCYAMFSSGIPLNITQVPCAGFLKLLLVIFDEKFQLSISALISVGKCKGQEHHHDFL